MSMLCASLPLWFNVRTSWRNLAFNVLATRGVPSSRVTELLSVGKKWELLERISVLLSLSRTLTR